MASLMRAESKMYKCLAASLRYVNTTNQQGMTPGNTKSQSANQNNSQNLVYSGSLECRYPQRKLFTPTVLNVSERVKHAMMTTDPGIRHAEYTYAVNFLRNALLRIARASGEDFTVIPVNGSGALAIESTLRTMLMRKKGKLIIMNNGSQSDEIVEICKSGQINFKLIPMDLNVLQQTLLSFGDISGVLAVQCELYTGLVNPINQIGEIVKKIYSDCYFIVDASVTFGAMPIDMTNIDFLVGDSCKSLQGAPGMAFVIARKRLMETKNYNGDSLVMDLTMQYDELERTGELRFTPPVHIINALKEAILELSEEGGVDGRLLRYRENNDMLKRGMADMGFEQLYTDDQNPNGYISTTFRNPLNPLFVLDEFRSRLNDYGFVVTESIHVPRNTFCLGNIGNLHPEDVSELLRNVRQVCHDMRMAVPLRQENY